MKKDYLINALCQLSALTRIKYSWLEHLPATHGFKQVGNNFFGSIYNNNYPTVPQILRQLYLHTQISKKYPPLS